MFGFATPSPPNVPIGHPYEHTWRPNDPKGRTRANIWPITNFCPPFQHLLSGRLTFLGIMGTPRVSPLNPSETIVLRGLSSLRGLKGATEVPPLCRETSVSRTANDGTVGINGLNEKESNRSVATFKFELLYIHVYIYIYSRWNLLHWFRNNGSYG